MRYSFSKVILQFSLQCVILSLSTSAVKFFTYTERMLRMDFDASVTAFCLISLMTSFCTLAANFYTFLTM